MKFNQLIETLQHMHQELQTYAARSVDTALVIRNWLFGWYIVEYEQNGTDRASYGKQLLKTISIELTQNIGKGFSVDNLELMRKFYSTYSLSDIKNNKSETLSRISNSISETPSRKSAKQLDSAEIIRGFIPALAKQFNLSWSHYVVLLTIKSTEERRFYEIETLKNSWGIRELKRQISSSLYERLALSRDKNKIKELSEKGHLITTPKDILKSPYVLEFLDLEEKFSYSEHEMEKAIIDKIEQFLLELGKGFLFEARQKRFTFDDDHFYVDLVFVRSVYTRMLPLGNRRCRAAPIAA